MISAARSLEAGFPDDAQLLLGHITRAGYRQARLARRKARVRLSTRRVADIIWVSARSSAHIGIERHVIASPGVSPKY